MSSPLSRQSLLFADGTVRVLLAEALLLPTGLITAGYLTRNLGAEGYGLFTLAATLVGWIGWSSTSLFARASIKFVSEADDWRPVGSTVLRLHIASGVISAVLLLLAAGPISSILGEPRLMRYAQLFAIDLLFFNVAWAHREILTGTGRFRQQSIAIAFRLIARLVLIIVFVEAGLSIWGAILGSMGATLVELTIYRIFTRPRLSLENSFPARQLLRFATPLFFYALALKIFNRVDLFALSALGGTTAQVGYYGAAQNLAVVPGLFSLSFSPLLLSTLGRLTKTGQDEEARLLVRNAMRVVVGLLPFAAMTCGAASEIASVIFGSAFVTTGPLLGRLIFSGVGLVMISVTTVIMIVAGRPGWTFILALCMLVPTLAGHLLFIPRFGAIGAASVTTSIALLGAVAGTVAVYRLWKTVPPLATIVRTAVLSAAAYGIAAFWPTPGLLVVSKILVVIVLILGGFLLLLELNGSERRFVRSLFHEWRGRNRGS